jgi:hypothetical protein
LEVEAMWGVGFVKVPPTTFVMLFRNGRVRREGLGLSFFYLEPGATIVAVPAGSTDVPFIFPEVTGDFQGVTVQGHLTFRVSDPRRLAALLDYSLRGRVHATDDPIKLPARIAQAAQTATRAEVQARTLRAALVEADTIGTQVLAALRAQPTLAALGVEVLAFAILAIKPAPETGRALEAEARERLLREADDAVYARRNNAVEQERTIKENELATEKAVQAKQREIDETKMEASIHLEQRRTELVGQEAENVRLRADAQAYASEKQLGPLKELDPRSLQVLAAGSSDPRLLVAMAFQEIAQNAAKVGTLNISPDLLETLMAKGGRG